jgi:hypothetical protein
MRLSLLSDDNEIAELLINKAMELMSQAETVAAQGDADAASGSDTHLPTSGTNLLPDEGA